MNERRQQSRRKLALPIELGSAQGVTLDVSSSGVYFRIPEPVVAGSVIEFSMRLPRLAAEGLELRCVATVIRVTADPTGTGVAAKIDEYDLLPIAS